MKNKTFYYARVSTREQNLDRQLEAFRQLGATDREIITDKESGKNLERPGDIKRLKMLCCDKVTRW